LLRPGFVNSAGIIGKKMRAEGRNPDYAGFWIIRPSSGMIILDMYFFRVGVFEGNEPATGTAFFTLHTIFSYFKNLIKNNIS